MNRITSRKSVISNGNSPAPKGMTLTEVLMALMVMGIGLVSVVTLFPLSLLRSIEATKTTNATLLKQNAKARIESLDILQDPDNDGNTAEHKGERFVFDPLGAVIMNDAGTAPPLSGFSSAVRAFGDLNGDGFLDLADGFLQRDRNGDNQPDPILRYTFGYNTEKAAERFVTLPDSFNTIFEGLAGTGTFTVATSGTPARVVSITVTDGTLDGYADTDTDPEVRLSVFNAGANTSAVVRGDVEANGVVHLEPPIPARVGTSPSRIIIDIPERRYTWIATVNKVGDSEVVYIAVFFRRSFSPRDEEVFELTEPAGSYNVFEMTKGAPNNITAETDMPPGFEVGGWMLDLNTFRWWKIVEIQDLGGAYRFSTDPETYDPSADFRGNIRAIFPQNIVEVYPLGD